jgi:predicted RND superfamily exporter protein
MKDVFKFAIMLMAAAFVWMVVNPIHILVSLIVAAFPVVIIFGAAGLAVAGYRIYQQKAQEEDDFS